MCFTVVQNEPPQIAEEDITVYKVCDKIHSTDRVLSYLFNTDYPNGYNWGEVYTAIDRDNHEVTEFFIKDSEEISEGFHSFTNLEAARRAADHASIHYTDPVIVECQIPKETKYYINDDTEQTVSMKLIFVKEVE